MALAHDAAIWYLVGASFRDIENNVRNIYKLLLNGCYDDENIRNSLCQCTGI